jgi:hypothetical protein
MLNALSNTAAKMHNIVRFFAGHAAKKWLLSEQQKSGIEDIGSFLPVTPENVFSSQYA